MTIRNLPGVTVTETDLSQVVEGQGGSVAVFCGFTKKGPSNQIVRITNTKQMIDIFGTPNISETDFGVLGAIEYSKVSPLYFTRTVTTNDVYASSTFDVVTISAATSGSATAASVPATATTGTYLNTVDQKTELSAATNKFRVSAIGPGTWGNSIKFEVVNAFVNGTLSAGVPWVGSYDNAAITSATATAAQWGTSGYIWQSVFNLKVYENDTLIEDFFGTVGDVLSDSGENLNILEKVNGVSKYVFISTNPSVTAPIPLSIVKTSLAGGVNGSTVLSNIAHGYKLYSSKNKVDIDLLVDTTNNSVDDIATSIDGVITSRKDCMGVVQVGTKTEVQTDSAALIAAKPSVTNLTYIAQYTGYDLVTDPYNNRKVYVPKTIQAARIIALTERDDKISKAPAGVARGTLPVLGQLVTFEDEDIGELYANNINTSKFVRGTGHVLWGQKTSTPLATARREIAVRRTLLFLEKSIEPTLFGFLFEPNTENTRSRITSILTSFMNTQKAEENVVDFSVVCNGTNNTPQDIDTNTLNVDVYIQPTRTIEFIKLNMIITRSGVTLTESA